MNVLIQRKPTKAHEKDNIIDNSYVSNLNDDPNNEPIRLTQHSKFENWLYNLFNDKEE